MERLKFTIEKNYIKQVYNRFVCLVWCQLWYNGIGNLISNIFLYFVFIFWFLNHCAMHKVNWSFNQIQFSLPTAKECTLILWTLSRFNLQRVAVRLCNVIWYCLLRACDLNVNNEYYVLVNIELNIRFYSNVIN